jgi:hypothetical protein
LIFYRFSENAIENKMLLFSIDFLKMLLKIKCVLIFYLFLENVIENKMILFSIDFRKMLLKIKRVFNFLSIFGKLY